MKRQTRDELAAECERLRDENTVLSHAVHILQQRQAPNARETVRERDGGRYVYEAYNVTAPHGGILLRTFYYPGQSPHTTVHYLDKYWREQMAYLREYTAHRIAVDRLRAKARALQLAAYASKSA